MYHCFPVLTSTKSRCQLGKLLSLESYWARDEDLEFIAKKLVESPTNRGTVHYLAAPSGYGKTSSILPAFLKSTEMEKKCSHYLYLSFANNDLNHYKYTGIIDDEYAEQEGALFIFECLKILLGSTNKKGQHLINFKGYEKLPPLEETRGKLKEYLASIARPDQKEQLEILVHVDEHRKMCKPEHSASWLSKRAMFSKSALPQSPSCR